MAVESELQENQPDGQAAAAHAKLVLRAVYIMGINLVLLMFALVAGIVWKATHRAAAGTDAGPVQFDLGMAADETMVAALLDGDRLAVTTNRGLIIVDLRKNRVTARIGLRRQ